jgi:DNA-binding FadR family transcriptional regulator
MKTDPAAVPLGSIVRINIPDQIAAILRQFILVEDLSEGDQLPSERELARTLGVSHRAVREALGQLAGEGVIRKEHGRGNFVNSLGRDDLVSQLGPFELALPDLGALHEARAAIERGIMHLVAHRATEEDLAALEASIRSMERHARAGESFVADDLGFHLTLLRATENEALHGLQEIITTSVRLHDLWRSPQGLRRNAQPAAHILRAHRAILQALQERDGARACEAMHRHLTWRRTDGVQKP